VSNPFTSKFFDPITVILKNKQGLTDSSFVIRKCNTGWAIDWSWNKFVIRLRLR